MEGKLAGTRIVPWAETSKANYFPLASRLVTMGPELQRVLVDAEFNVNGLPGGPLSDAWASLHKAARQPPLD